MASKVTIPIRRGSSWSMQIQWTDSSNTPVNAVGLVASIAAAIVKDCTIIVAVTVTDVDLSLGKWLLSLESDETVLVPEYALSELEVTMTFVDGKIRKWPNATVKGIGCP